MWSSNHEKALDCLVNAGDVAYVSLFDAQNFFVQVYLCAVLNIFLYFKYFIYFCRAILIWLINTGTCVRTEHYNRFQIIVAHVFG